MAFTAAGKDDARGATVLKGDTLHMGARLEAQVRALQHGLQEATRRAPAPASLLVHLEISRALVVPGVEVLDLGDAGGLAGVANGVEDVPAHARIFDAPFPAAAMRLVRGSDMVLMREEGRQDIVPAPAWKSELAPAVVIRGLAAHVDHGVDRG